MIERAPFRRAEDALRFLFNPNRAVCERSAASRMADKCKGEPGLLSGLDGAATAASAEAMLKGRLTPTQLAILACRYAPNKMRCECKADCCSGWRTNARWREAISYVAHDALYQALPRGETAHLRFVTAILMREYGKKRDGKKKIVLTDLGTDLGMSLGTCSNHRRRVLDWLLRPQKPPEESKSEKQASALPPGKEVVAFSLAEEVLCLGGFIE